MALSLREIKPKTARTKRIVESKAPQHVENPRTTLYLRYTSSSEVLNLVMADLHALQRPRARKFNKKNPIHPFEDASSLEFFSQKNDASLMVFASHAKKRPHCLTLARFFDARVLDMLELLVDPDSLRTLRQFPTAKPPVGAKPLLAFSGAPFDSPVAGPHTLARSLLTDLFRGPDAAAVDVEGLRHLIHFTADEEADGRPPAVHMRCYLLRTASVAGTTLPRVEVEEMGPRIDFRLGRRRDADPDMWKESLKRPANSEAKTKKNVTTDAIGDKLGRIHVGKQDLGRLQTRKMKGLKRGREVDDAEVGAVAADDMAVMDAEPEKRVRVQ